MTRKYSLFMLFLGGIFLSGCAMQRASDAASAQQRMVGLSKEQVFICMGIPSKKAHEGETTIWEYKSTNGYTTKSKGTSSTSLSGALTASLGFSDEERTSRFCTVQIVMQEDHVKLVHYTGPTGGFLTEDEQCAYAVRNCLHPQQATP